MLLASVTTSLSYHESSRRSPTRLWRALLEISYRNACRSCLAAQTHGYPLTFTLQFNFGSGSFPALLHSQPHRFYLHRSLVYSPPRGDCQYVLACLVDQPELVGGGRTPSPFHRLAASYPVMPPSGQIFLRLSSDFRSVYLFRSSPSLGVGLATTENLKSTPELMFWCCQRSILPKERHVFCSWWEDIIRIFGWCKKKLELFSNWRGLLLRVSPCARPDMETPPP
jgi:hypothetical protein